MSEPMSTDGPYVMRIYLGVGTLGNVPPRPFYLAAFDVDAHDGRGHTSLTVYIDHAMRFATAADALAAWERQSAVRPIRPDGKPNRPLSAYTIEIERVPSDR